MLGMIMRTRALARIAVVGLTIGLAALAALALFSTASTAQITAQVRSDDNVAAQWSQLILHVSFEDEQLADYLKAGSGGEQQPLISAVGSAEPNLRWLETKAGPAEAAAASTMRDSYQAYTDSLRQLIDAGKKGDWVEVSNLADEANLGAASMRKVSVSNVVRKGLEMNAYLEVVDQKNHQLRLAGGVVCAVDFLLLTLCALILLGHQRRIERQAVESRHQALHDGLTGIPNRILMNDRLEQALRAAGRHNEYVALLLLDLNRFKEINDTLGHHAGDLLLKVVAQRLVDVVRDHDTVARLGGDEFAVVLPRVGSVEHAMEIADRVLDALQRPADLDGIVVDVSGSIGVSVYPENGDNAIELLQHADIAMYTAKRGHLGTAMYDPDADQHNSALLVMLRELRQGIDSGELVLYYQPKIRAGGAGICGVEALVRWQHPTRGLLGPAEFVPLAEDSDLIGPLTEWVLDAALKQHREWRRAGRLLPIAVNIATRSLLDAGFADRIVAMLAEHEVAPGQLTLEITESALITDVACATDILRRLYTLGVRLAIDDFGTGYSSMAYLQTMPLHELKIDRRFIAAVQSSLRDAAIVRAILQLAHALGLEAVAEGVEDAGTWATLDEMGCDIAQGFLWSLPVVADDLTAWLANQPELVDAMGLRS
jgi:diguanylate cyclase (GGDEF)-like protein